MKRFFVFCAAVVAAVVVLAPPASAHTGTITITCTQVTYSFILFKDATTVIHETVTIDGVTVANQNFTLVGASGGNTINISVPAGTHTVVATASWTDSEGGGTITRTQVVSGCQPAAICTLTKGFYRNHSAATAQIIAARGGTLTVDGVALTASQVQAILNATPGQPGSITFSSNSLLNLTQQLITVLLNVQGNTLLAPAAVQTAVAAVNAGITITGGTAITTTLSKPQVGALTAALSAFNEGLLAGFAHCG